MTVPKTQWRPGSGKPYFAPVGETHDDQERPKKLRAAEELLEQAFLLGNRHEAHSVEDFAKSAELYEAAALAYEAIGSRSYDAQCARFEAKRCLAAVAAANAEPKKGDTGT